MKFELKTLSLLFFRFVKFRFQKTSFFQIFGQILMIFMDFYEICPISGGPDQFLAEKWRKIARKRENVNSFWKKN